jgi:hypothetical protein
MNADDQEIHERLIHLETLVESLIDILQLLESLTGRVQRLEDAIAHMDSRQNERLDEVLRKLDDGEAVPPRTQRPPRRGL